MSENLERNKKMSKRKAMLAAIGMAVAAEAAIPATNAEAQTIEQYTYDDRLGQDPRIAKLPKETTLFQSAGPGQANVLDGAKLDPKITHICQTSRGDGRNLIVNADKIPKHVVIIQEGPSNSSVFGDGNVTISGHGNVITGKKSNSITLNGKPLGHVDLPDQWPFNKEKGNPFKPGFPFNK